MKIFFFFTKLDNSYSHVSVLLPPKHLIYYRSGKYNGLLLL